MKIDYCQDDNYEQTKIDNLRQSEAVSTFIKFNRNNFDKIKKLQQQKLLHLRKKKNPLDLKELVTKSKVEILKKNFIRKMKRNRVERQIPNGVEIEEKVSGTTLLSKFLICLENTFGLELSPVMLSIWSFINIIQISIMIILFSIQIAFPQTQDLQSFLSARVFSITLYIIDMILNFITQRHEIGGNKKNLKQISHYYMTHEFLPDFFSIAIFPLSYAFEAKNVTPFVMLIALLKLKNNLKRFESFEFIYVKTNSRELYYGLVKVFLLNFSIGHILSIFLNLMAGLSENGQNWYQKVDIVNEPWLSKYIWGYYWGTNIMLTVGFGDISATNTTEAIILIFIETLSCITLAYNISCVGSIISELKAETDEKKKRLKYFHRMCEDNKISEDLGHKINNFIEQSYLIKEQFQIEEYEEVINSLPKSMQSEYRKEANKSLFDVGFFNSLNNKTILNLAEYVIRKVAHPEQTLQRKGEIQNFCILQKGCLGFTCRSGLKSILNGVLIEKFQIQKSQTPKILSLGFIKRKILTYDIKSLFYSIYYYLPYEQLMNTLKFCEMDYHFFLFMKDKDDTILGSNEIYQCKICNDDYHTLFECPKHHYVPLKEKVLIKYLKNQLVQRVPRNSIEIERSPKQSRPLLELKQIQEGYEKYLAQNFDEDQIKQIKNIKKYFYEKNIKSVNSIDNIIDMMKRQKNPFEQQFQKIEDMITKVTYAALDFWNVQSDAACDFKYYFKEYNPNRLIQFKTNTQKKKARDMIFGIHAFKRGGTPGMTLISNRSTYEHGKYNLDSKMLDQGF